MYLFDKAG